MKKIFSVLLAFTFLAVFPLESEYPFLQPGYRRLVVKPFVMYYRIVNQTVYITHIIHVKRSQAKAFAEGNKGGF